MTAEEALETMDERLFYFNDYSKTFSPCIVKISQDLERLEKLEKAIDILKDNLHLYKGLFNCLSINGGHEYSELTDQEYELLKEVLGNV